MKSQSEDDESDDDLPLLPINRVESYDIWIKWRFFEKRLLPFPGGFLSQPQWVLDDLVNIEAMYQRVVELQE